MTGTAACDAPARHVRRQNGGLGALLPQLIIGAAIVLLARQIRALGDRLDRLESMDNKSKAPGKPKKSCSVSSQCPTFEQGFEALAGSLLGRPPARRPPPQKKRKKVEEDEEDEEDEAPVLKAPEAATVQEAVEPSVVEEDDEAPPA